MKNAWKYVTVVLIAAIAVVFTAIVTKNYEPAEKRPAESSKAPATAEATEDDSRCEETSEAATGSETAEPTEDGTVEPTEPKTQETEETKETEKPSSSEPAPTEKRYQDTVSDVTFIGDSRTVFMGSAIINGVSGSKIAPDSSIYATYGAQLISHETFRDAEQAGAAGRKKATFWYGINDVQLNADRNNALAFLANYKAVVNTFRAKNPNAAIYILSIVDSSPEEKDYYEGQAENIYRYNEALISYANEQGFTYVNLAVLVDNMTEDIFLPDHIHFTDAFYRALADYLRDELEIEFK